MKTVLITGANRGLGFLLTKKLAQLNYRVIMTGRDLTKLNDAYNSVNLPNVHQFQLDTSNVKSMQQLLLTLQNDNVTIDVLVNNAAVVDPIQYEDSTAEYLMNINYYGPIHLTRILKPILTKQAKIIMISSNLGKLAIQPEGIRNQLNKPMSAQQIDQLVDKFISNYKDTRSFNGWYDEYKPIYSASKALLNAYSRHVISNEIGDEQSLYCIHPGWLKTDMGGVNAPQEPEEGIITSTYLINDVPFGRNIEYHGKYFNEKCIIEEY